MRFGRKDKGRNPRARSGSKVPLTYYRSSSNESQRDSSKKSSKTGRFRKSLLRLADFLVVSALLVGLIYCLLLKPEAEVRLNDESYHPTADYQEVAAASLKTLKNRNKLTIDEQEIVSKLKKTFPEIESAYLQLPLVSQKPRLDIIVSTPSLFLTTGSETYVIDSRGHAVAKKSELPKLRNLPVVQDRSDFVVASGQRILSSSSVEFIDLLVSQCRRTGIEIDSLTLPTLAQELDLKTKDSNYFVKFLTSSEPMQQIGQFLAARQQFQTSGERPTQYLDVRVPGKIYHK